MFYDENGSNNGIFPSIHIHLMLCMLLVLIFDIFFRPAAQQSLIAFTYSIKLEGFFLFFSFFSPIIFLFRPTFLTLLTVLSCFDSVYKVFLSCFYGVLKRFFNSTRYYSSKFSGWRRLEQLVWLKPDKKNKNKVRAKYVRKSLS